MKVSTASALQTTSTSERTRLLCEFCGRGHPTERCLDVSGLTIPERHDQILSAKLCFCCLGKNHVAKGCLAKCSHCNGKQHKLCCKLVNGTNDASVSEQSSNGSNIEKGSVSNITHVGVASSVKSVNNVRCTLLQTASVNVKGKQGIAKATLLFDSGSDRSYISCALVDKLKPEFVSSEPVMYTAFGNGKPEMEIYTMFLVSCWSLSAT